MERELNSKEKQKIDLELQKTISSNDIESYACDDVLKIPINDALRGIIDNYRNVVKTRTVKKLNTLYHGRFVPNKEKSICVKNDVDSFVNLTA